jgi:pimeloyl-[acyl-carrier protein] methyl ester esterase
MTLYAQTTGAGPDLVLLHGWALHGGLFAPLAAALADRYRVTCIDLPGHGRSHCEPAFDDLAGLASIVAAALPPACTLLGWSLGGMVAAQIAASGHHAPERLVLVASTPRFVADASWPHGLAAPIVHEFAAQLRRDPQDLIRRFLSLQARGDERQVALLRQLRAAVFEHGEPSPAALEAGLAVLTESDLRGSLGGISVPTLVVAGEYDRLTPAAASRWMAANIPTARLSILKAAGHAPFLSHAHGFLEALLGFLPPGAGRRDIA